MAIITAFLVGCGKGVNSEFFGEVPAIMAEQHDLSQKLKQSSSEEELDEIRTKAEKLDIKLITAYQNLNGKEWKINGGDSIKVISPLKLNLDSEHGNSFKYKITGEVEVTGEVPVKMDKYSIENLNGSTSCGIYIIAWYDKNGFPTVGYVQNDGSDPIYWISEEIGTVGMRVEGNRYFIPKGTRIKIDSQPFYFNFNYNGDQGKCNNMCLVFSTDRRILK